MNASMMLVTFLAILGIDITPLVGPSQERITRTPSVLKKRHSRLKGSALIIQQQPALERRVAA